MHDLISAPNVYFVSSLCQLYGDWRLFASHGDLELYHNQTTPEAKTSLDVIASLFEYH